jgi:hypothetical protein
MLSSKHMPHAFSFLSAWLFLVIFFFTAPTSLPAGEKTPPCYPEGQQGGSPPDLKPSASLPAKDFPSLFKGSTTVKTDEKTSSRYREEDQGRPAPTEKPDVESSENSTLGMDDGTFQTQEYVVKEGDWLVKILREKGLIRDQNLPELLSLLRKLNTSLQDLNMIQPGEKIIILVKVVPDRGSEREAPRKLKHETYTVKRGDILSRVAMRRYNLSKEEFNRGYLRLFAACNPSIEDPNRLLVGQVIKLPHYPPEHADTGERLPGPVLRDLEKSPHRVALKAPTPMERPQPPQPAPSLPPKTPPPSPPPVKGRPEPAAKDTPPPTEPWPASLKPVTSAPGEGGLRTERTGEATIIITDGLGTVISRMGEEWIHSGEHIIPMKSGGHIHLKADSYPIARLNQGITVIVDMHSALPQSMARVLESTWANYRVVRLSASDDLRSALDKILNAFNYPQVLKKGAPLTLRGDIPVSITGDWIVTPPHPASGKGPGFVVINLMDNRNPGLPRTIKNYLKLLGVEVIEYPSTEEGPSDAGGAVSTAETATNPEELIEAVLNLRGQPFTARVNIPAYATRNEDFKFTVQADFYLEIRGQRYIIDMGGLSSDVVSLLKNNGISVLSLAQEKEPVGMVSRILEFLEVRFDRGPHSFMATTGDETRNVKLTLAGITFHDRKGTTVLATSLNLPPEIVSFLSERGYRVLVLAPLGPPGSGSA